MLGNYAYNDSERQGAHMGRRELWQIWNKVVVDLEKMAMVDKDL